MLPPLNSILFHCNRHGIRLVVYYFYAPAVPATFHLPAVDELVELDHAVFSSSSVSCRGANLLMALYSSEILSTIKSIKTQGDGDGY